MSNKLQRSFDRLAHRFLGRRLAGRAERLIPWLLLILAASLPLHTLPGPLRSLFSQLSLFALLALALLAGLLFFRWISRRALWTVRNRLIATYLLMGLAPVVLFGLLTGITAYLLSGQFATNTALSTLDAELLLLRERSVILSGYVAHNILVHPDMRQLAVPDLADNTRGSSRGRARNLLPSTDDLTFAAWVDGVPLQLTGIGALPSPQAALPAWSQPGFSGVVEQNGRLYLRAVDGFSFGPENTPRHSLRVAVSAPLSHDRLDTIARNLGVVSIVAGSALRTDETELEAKPKRQPGPFAPVSGGSISRSAFLVDLPVLFTAPMPCVQWQTGAHLPTFVAVASRASLLYSRLFSTSVRIGALVRTILIAIAVLFALLEGLALAMALRLSRTITRSVADLYQATTAIDRGHLDHRIPVRRRDQLGALAASFNKMSSSLADLLEQQRQKQRLENELSIAQQVQNNLFPPSPIHLPGFELHGVCKPARTVSGDYYDFLLASEGEICFTLGDISGKGISAALLMASLHAAVRAFSSADGNADEEAGAHGSAPFRLTSPARMLTLLNRHLLASTQPEKYATLFLACYNSATRRLTYANGGQPPPLLLRAQGQVQRLDCGGSVIGLLPGVIYEEATITLAPGDLVVAYSDGITEPENAFGEFGEERLLQLVSTLRRDSLANISRHTMRALHSWIGDAEQPDDITLVLARQL